MASNRNLSSTVPLGFQRGKAFDDSLQREGVNDMILTRIVVWADMFVNSLTMYYHGSEAVVARGGRDGTRYELLLPPGEFVTIIEGAWYSNVVGKLRFITNKGAQFGRFGSMSELSNLVPFVWKASDNVSTHLAPHMGLLYFSGYHDTSYIHQLRATFALYPVAEKIALHPKAEQIALHPKAEQGTIDMKYEKQVSTDTTASHVALSSFARNLMSPAVTLVVGTDKVQFHAPLATLCRIQSFRTALQGSFREASMRQLIFPDDAPEIFAALLEHLYSSSYTYTYDADTTMTANNIPVHDLAEGCFHIRVYALAFKYDWQPLVDVAVGNFLVMLQKLAAIDIVRLWKVAYENGLTVSMCEVDGRLAKFQIALPTLLEGLYKTDAAEMESTVLDMPSLANDFMRLLVSGKQ